MPDRLDDLLQQLPAGTMSADLPARIQMRLRVKRSRERRFRIGLDVLMAVLVLCGGLALAPSAAGAADWLTGGSVESSMTWVSRLGSAPAPVVWETMAGAMDWARGLSGRFGVAGLLGLVLLSVPLFAWLRRLMPEDVSGFDPGAEWSVARMEEGVGA
ncbi:MAG TPA: hypothetical protein VI701_06440 [Anaerolineales bacterium]|nr:hypothetical protein [Anaerolineales bacterium]